MTNLEILLLVICIYLLSFLLMALYKPIIDALKAEKDHVSNLFAYFMFLIIAPLIALYILISSPFVVGRWN